MDGNYLTDFPDGLEKYGFDKILLVRWESIHIKHILTEVLVRRTVNVDYIQYMFGSVEAYAEYITNRLRTVFKLSRKTTHKAKDILSLRKDNLFDLIELYRGVKCRVLVDFDGTITTKKFQAFLPYLAKKTHYEVLTANPMVTQDWFVKKGLPLPAKIWSMKGKKKKVTMLKELCQRSDMCLFIDNEPEYLNYGWLLGAKTFLWKKDARWYSLNSK